MTGVVMMQNDITISMAQTLWLIGGITAVVTFVTWLMKPFKKLEDHENRITDNKNRIDAIETQREEDKAERRQTDQYMMSALNAMVNHLIDGDGKDELRRVRNEYQEQIIKHHQ